MPNLILVMLGGGLGAGARFLVGQLVANPAARFPWGTLLVNLGGGLAMGVLAGAAARHFVGEPGWLFAGVGLLGGFTTFSAFSLDAVFMIQRGDFGGAAAYIAASVLGALTLFAAGLMLVRVPG